MILVESVCPKFPFTSPIEVGFIRLRHGQCPNRYTRVGWRGAFPRAIQLNLISSRFSGNN